MPVVGEVDLGTARLMPDLDRPHAWLLTIDGVPHSHVDLDDPTYLEFEYVRRLAHLVDLTAPARTPLDVLHLGGGALSLARYVSATRPGSRQRVVEIDAALLALVREHLPWGPQARIRTQVADARRALEASRDDSLDVVVTDVFEGSRVPAHVASLEFVQQAARVLRRDGLYAMNLVDRAPLAFSRRLSAAVEQVFPQVYLISEPAIRNGRRFGNLILAGAARELPVDALVRRLAGDPFPARVEDVEALRRFTAGYRPATDVDAATHPTPPDHTLGFA